MKNRLKPGNIALAALVVAASQTSAQELDRPGERPPGRVSLGTGFEYSTGDYGSPDGDTNDWYVPFSVGYSHSNWRIKATVPYIRSTGPGNVLGAGETQVVLDEGNGDCVRGAGSNSGSGSSNSGSGSSNSGSGSSNSGSGSSNSGSGSSNSGSGRSDVDRDRVDDSVDCSVTTSRVVTTPGTQTVTRNTFEGFGDLTVAATYSFDPLAAVMPFIDLGARIKFPTGDKDLSTRAYDYTLRMDLYRPIGDFALFGGVGYTFKGDIDATATSDGLRLDNIITATLGGEYNFTDALLAGVQMDYREASSEFAVDAWDLSGYATWRATGGLSLTGTVGTGFTDSGADFLGGLSLVYRFDSPF